MGWSGRGCRQPDSRAVTGMRHVLACVGVLALLAACEPDATPLPAYVPPTVTTLPATATPGPLRYALAAETRGSVVDLALLEASAEVTLLEPDEPTDLGNYALMAGYGDRPGWARSPVTPRVSLAIGGKRAPLDEPAMAGLIVSAIDAQALVSASGIGGSEALSAPAERGAQRAALANAGWPDGFDVALGDAGLPGTEALIGQLAALGLNVSRVALPPDALIAALTDGRVNLALVAWTDERQRQAMAEAVGAERVIDLYTLPITFQAVDGLRLTFTPGGWPLASR